MRAIPLLLGLTLLAGAAATPVRAEPAATLQKPKEKAAPKLALFPGNLDQARKRAAERNVPIVAVALLDEEPDNVAALKTLLASPEFAALSGRCLVFFSNHGKHATTEVVEQRDGETKTRTICSAFRTSSCKDHQQHWDDLYNHYNEDGVLRCPQVLVVAPDGKLEERIAPGLQPEVSAIVESVHKLQTRLGRGLDDAALARLTDAQSRAAKAELAGESGTAWRALAVVLEISPEGPRAAAAKEGQKRALEAFAKARDAASKKLGGDARLEGYRELEALGKQWEGTETAAEVTRLLRAAEKDPLLKEALARVKRESEAQTLWDEAQAAAAAKQPKVQEKKVRLLLKKYAGTPAYEKAAAAHPDWLPEKPAAQ